VACLRNRNSKTASHYWQSALKDAVRRRRPTFVDGWQACAEARLHMGVRRTSRIRRSLRFNARAGAQIDECARREKPDRHGVMVSGVHGRTGSAIGTICGCGALNQQRGPVPRGYHLVRQEHPNCCPNRHACSGVGCCGRPEQSIKPWIIVCCAAVIELACLQQALAHGDAKRQSQVALSGDSLRWKVVHSPIRERFGNQGLMRF
jgi:hypothetical protein